MPITPPKHMSIPDIPRISELGFETLMLVFSLMSLALQYLNIYRTVFWLPHSHTKYAMVSYLSVFALAVIAFVLKDVQINRVYLMQIL